MVTVSPVDNFEDAYDGDFLPNCGQVLKDMDGYIERVEEIGEDPEEFLYSVAINDLDSVDGYIETLENVLGNIQRGDSHKNFFQAPSSSIEMCEMQHRVSLQMLQNIRRVIRAYSAVQEDLELSEWDDVLERTAEYKQELESIVEEYFDLGFGPHF